MRIIIIGSGFSGLTAAYRLLRVGHQVVVLESENTIGGLAIGYKHRDWEWSLDKAYHHLFTNDDSAIKLAREIGQKLDLITPQTCVQARGEIIPFDSPLTLLTYPYLNLIDKIRTATALLYLKLTNDYTGMENTEAIPWIIKYMGMNSYKAIWEPLFRGKFHDQAKRVMMPWFWARIKKRTQSLLYPRGGFMAFLDLLAKRIKQQGGEIVLGTPVISVKQDNNEYVVKTKNIEYLGDQIIYTGPTSLFPKLFGQALRPIRKPHQYLHAQIMILRLKESLMKDTYWLNVTDPGYPFLVLVEHTNFVKAEHYGGEHIIYVGNYLPPNHPYLTKTPKQLFSVFLPYLEKIKPGAGKLISSYDVFTLPYAQAVVNRDYVSNIKKIGTGLEGVYIANIDSVYPWDRGTNYAIKKGNEIAQLIMNTRE